MPANVLDRETYVGGKTPSTRHNPVTGKLVPTNPQKDKTIVMGVVERKGRVRAFIVPNSKATTLVDRSPAESV